MSKYGRRRWLTFTEVSQRYEVAASTLNVRSRADYPGKPYPPGAVQHTANGKGVWLMHEIFADETWRKRRHVLS